MRVIRVFSFLFAVMMFSCANNGDIKNQKALSGPGFGELENTEWFLNEVKTGSETISINMASNIYSLKVEDGLISGTAAPNLYSAPYTAGEDGSLSIGMARSTMMASLFEPEGLKENEFFGYLAKVTGWKLTDENLELYTAGEDGSAAVMVFIPKD